MSAIGFMVAVTLVIWFSERKQKAHTHRDQPCFQCHRTISWRSGEWVHAQTGRHWDPPSTDPLNKWEIFRQTRQIPHPAFPEHN